MGRYKQGREPFFAAYRGDTFLTEGTIYEVAAFLGISRVTATHYHMPSYLERIKGRANRTMLVRLDDEDDDLSA